MATRPAESPEDYADALDALTRAIELAPDNAVAHYQRGMALLGLNRKTEAIAEFNCALAIEERPDALEWRGYTLESIALDNRLRELRDISDPGMGVNPLEWTGCADALGPEEGRLLLEEYFESHAQNVTSFARYETAPMRSLAWLLLQSHQPGDVARGCELAEQAYASAHQSPDDVLVHALALEAVGDPDAARRVCLESLQINDKTPYHIRAIHQRLTDATD